ncbi:MAG: hypothetical protein ICV74_02630 [Thermoleophilia bacterium]|nr:hypothetical protein [Thermoleophilia bacterium]
MSEERHGARPLAVGAPLAGNAADEDLLRLDYDKTTQLVRDLTEIRFKLLAFVPTIAGAAVAFLSDPGSASELLAVGLLGLVATLGIFAYELRNTELYAAALERARVLERRLGLRSAVDDERLGGVFSERPQGSPRFFWRTTVWHGRGVALVYGAAFGGWSYLVAWGAFALVDLPAPRTAGGVVGAAAAAFVIREGSRGEGAREQGGG